jgi:hypothetical protein
MLAADDREAAVEDAAAFADEPSLHWWDGSKKLGAEIARSLDRTDWTAWDIYLVYRAGAHTIDGHLPPPSGALLQTHGIVAAPPGLLPPAPDQSALPAGAAGRAVVVGSQDDLELLLERAVP